MKNNVYGKMVLLCTAMGSLAAMAPRFFSITTPPLSRVQSGVLSPVSPDSDEQALSSKSAPCERIVLDFVPAPYVERPARKYGIEREIEEKTLLLVQMRKAAKYDADGEMWVPIYYLTQELVALRERWAQLVSGHSIAR